MLRTIFVIVIIGVGAGYAIRKPFYSLLLYLWLAYFRPEQWVWYDFISGLKLSFIVGIWTIFASLFSREKFRFNVRIAFLLLFLLQSLVSILFADHTQTSWPYFIDFCKWILMTYLIVVMVTDIARLRLILLVIALSLGFEAAKQGWATLVLRPGGSNDNILPMLGDNNGVAVGMMMLVPILTTLAGTATARWERWLDRVFAIGVLNRGLTTYSRGGFLACLALALTYAARSTRRIPAIAGIVLACAIILPVLPDAFWKRMNTIKTPDEINQRVAATGEMSEEDASSLGRVHFWNVALKMANDRPLTGVGYDAFNDTYDDYDDSNGAYGRQRSVHSAWLGVLAELGYPGLFLFLAQIGLAFGAIRRARRAAKVGGEYAQLKQYAFGLEAGFVAFIVGGTFLPFQYTEMLWHWFGLTIALDGIARTALARETVPVRADVGRLQTAPLPTASRTA